MSSLIKSAPELETACTSARAVGVLALDTEFVWRTTYRPRLGIVQMGAGGDLSWAVDVLKGFDPAPLARLVEDNSVVKVLHDARQDLALIRHYCGALPRNVFDTQLAAGFVGFSQGMGLQKLLFEVLDVGLAKTETCTDWTQRPLTEAQVGYALDDVRYLPALREELLKRADELGTREWLTEEMARFEKPSLCGDYDSENGWKRIKTHRAHIVGAGYAVLRELALAREELAAAWNLPRGWLGEDGALVFLAETRDVSRLRHRLANRSQAELLKARYQKAIRTAEALPKQDWPENPHPHYIAEVREAADAALEWLDKAAEKLHIAPEIVANRATMIAFVDDVENPDNPLSEGWRWEVFGHEIADRFGVD